MPSSPHHYNAWVLDHYAEGGLDGSELRFEHHPLPALKAGEVLIQTLLLSIDASNLLWLSQVKDYMPQLKPGDVMRGGIIGRIFKSRHPEFKKGDHLFTMQGWRDYTIVPGDELLNDSTAFKVIPHPDIPLDAYIGILGPTGWAAYVGMVQIGKVKAGERVLVSGAAGATGMAAAQIAKASGAIIYGMAGGKEKCRFLKNTLKLDGTIDYQSCDDLSEAIKADVEDGIELFFDNVGGKILDAALANMCNKGRIIASGSISQYSHMGNRKEQYGVKNLPMVTAKRLRMEGFLILDHLKEVPGILKRMEQWLQDGKLVSKNDIVHGLENAQNALPRLFSGGNIGKLAVYLTEHGLSPKSKPAL